MSEFFHSIGEHIICRGGEIGKIVDIRRIRFGGIGEKVYYVVAPIYDEHAVMYIPAGGKDDEGMRQVLTAKQIDAVIAEAESRSGDWVEDPKERAALFGGILENGSRTDILRVFKALSLYKLEIEKQKKRLYMSDARLLEAAEKRITEEFAFALGLKRDEVVPYIVSRISGPLTVDS